MASKSNRISPKFILDLNNLRFKEETIARHLKIRKSLENGWLVGDTLTVELLSQSEMATGSLALFQNCFNTLRDKLDDTIVMPLLFCYFDPVIVHLSW